MGSWEHTKLRSNEEEEEDDEGKLEQDLLLLNIEGKFDHGVEVSPILLMKLKL